MTQRHAPLIHRSETRPEIDLNGEWSFATDPDERGEREGWFARDLSGTIAVPGSWEEQGVGEPPPEQIVGWTKRRSYVGAAWYQRTVAVPDSWAGRCIWLQLDRVGWQSSVWVNGRRAGGQDSLSTPHRFDLTGLVEPGAANRIAIRVTNNVTGVLNYEGHAHSRHTATNWGGIVGPVRLIATPSTWVDHVAIFPDAERRLARCVVRVLGVPGRVEVRGVVSAGDRTEVEAGETVTTGDGGATVDLTFELGAGARLWSDTDPFLHDVAVELRTEEESDRVRTRFGLRTVSSAERKLFLNGQPLFLRGYVDCCIFPLTGYPPYDKETYAAQFARARAYGFNHVRLHSWTPPAPFFEAADEAGMLVQTELPNWGNCNDPAYLAGAGDFLRREQERVIEAVQHHPSLIIHCMGNELLQRPPGGAFNRFSPFLNDLVETGRRLDPSRLHVDQSGFGTIPEDPQRKTDLNVFHSFRGATPDTTATWSARVAGGRVPVVAHEHTQMDMYVRLAEAGKFTGIMAPSWIEQAREGLAAKGLLDDADLFVAASAALQVRCLKELFERMRRTPEMSGLQMLNFTDFPGQASALNGVHDVFWDEKGAISAEEFRRFNDETVLLCASPRRTFPGGGWLEARLLVSHYGSSSFQGTLDWALVDGTEMLARGQADARLEPGAAAWPLTEIAVRVPDDRPRALTLRCRLQTGDHEQLAENEWPFWSLPTKRVTDVPGPVTARPSLGWLSDYYPFIAVDQARFLDGARPPLPPLTGVILSDALHARYVDAMVNGATLVYLAENDELADGVRSRFESLFWSFLWFPEQPNQTMGLLIADHPLLATFPHDGHADWQWYDLVDGATAIGMDALPRDLKPVVAGIDNWNRAKRLGYLLEARVGRGRFLMTTLKLLDEYPRRPEGVHLLDALLRYVHSPDFAPAEELTLAHLWSIAKHPVAWQRP